MNDVDVLIVGSGFAGLGMGIRLKGAGIESFAILEQANEIGGTWRDNHYPGAACDIESHLYSFSFEPNPNWSRTFACQREILDYLRHCVDKYGLRPHLHLGVGVRSAAWDESTSTWTIETTTGETLRARAIVSGCGGLSRPSVPDIPGLDDFQGKAFHSARWDHDFPLEGKTVGVIGTGASAIQIVPSIAPIVGTLHVFQRTPPWIIPKADHPIPEETRAAYAGSRVRLALAREGLFWRHELLTFAFVNGKESRVMKLAARFAKRHIAKSIASPSLRAKLTPDYTVGCKRILLSNDYYPAIARDNVELVTDRIDRVVPEGVRTADGRVRKLDALVLATGFQAAEQAAPFTVTGRRGADLDTVWRTEAPVAYRGTTVAGFPNLFLIVGPNTGLGSSSMVLIIESQIAYVLDAIRTMKKRGIVAVDVKADAQRTYNEVVQERLLDTVWASGCRAWYTTRDGRNTTLWPGTTLEFRMRTRRFDLGAYHTTWGTFSGWDRASEKSSRAGTASSPSSGVAQRAPSSLP